MSLSSLIWLVAELLRGDYKQSDYGKVAEASWWPAPENSHTSDYECCSLMNETEFGFPRHLSSTWKTDHGTTDQ